MLSMNWSELFLIFIVALVVIGPKDIPKIMRAMGAFTARMRNFVQSMQRQWSAYVQLGEPEEKPVTERPRVERLDDEAPKSS